MRGQIGVVLNAASGQGHAASIEPWLRLRLGRRLELLQVRPENDVARTARSWAEQGVERIVVVGGDGTFRSIAAAMLGCPTPLGLVPAGTNNNIAGVLGLPTNLYEAAEVALGGEPGWISAGRIKESIFFEGAGVGLEADLWQIGEAVVRRRFGEILRAPVPLVVDRAADLEIVLDSEPATVRVRALTLTISNSRMTGAHLQFAPEADMRQPGLIMTVYEHINRVSFVGSLPRLARGRPGFGYRTVRYKFMRASIRARTTDPLHVHADGNLVGSLPIEVESLPNAVRVTLPRIPVAARAVA